MAELTLVETDLALRQVTELLDTHGRGDCADLEPQVLDYLTRHIVVLFCNEMERELTRIVMDRVDEAGDEVVSNLIKVVRGGLFRNIKTGEIADALAKLSPACKPQFNQLVERLDPQRATHYGAAVRKRNDTAHAAQPDVAFDDLVEAVAAGEEILDAVRAVVNSTRPVATGA